LKITGADRRPAGEEGAAERPHRTSVGGRAAWRWWLYRDGGALHRNERCIAMALDRCMQARCGRLYCRRAGRLHRTAVGAALHGADRPNRPALIGRIARR
jgi:hypothetical protein